MRYTANPTWGDIFECCFKAQSSKLERLFSLKRGKRDVRALSYIEYTYESVRRDVLHVALYVSMQSYVRIWKYTCMYAYKHMHLHVCVCVWTNVQRHTFTHVHTYTSLFLYVYVHTQIQPWTQGTSGPHPCTHTHTRARAHAQTHTHTH